MTDRGPLRLTDRRWDLLAFWLPVGIVVAFFVCYLVAPAFYLRFIINFKSRETQAVELLTIASALGAALILLPLAIVQWRNDRRAGGSLFPGGAAMIGVVGLAAFFFAGEEASWGQIYFHWKTPDEVKEVSRETNLHNGRLGKLVHEAGNLFVLTALVVAPLGWRLRDRLKLPADWRPGMAEWPAGAIALFALVLRLPKDICLRRYTDAQLHAWPLYWEYLEEIGEQKEMLVAMALLVYAIYRLQAVRRERAALSAGGVVGQVANQP